MVPDYGECDIDWLGNGGGGGLLGFTEFSFLFF